MNGRLVNRVIDKALVYAQYPARSLTRRTFPYHGVELRYFAHPYNATWRNERSIEIPIARHFIERWPRHARGLEVGNVLSHYQSVNHTVLDRYEIAKGVINEDVVDYAADPFDWIVAVSTLEHIGVNEPGPQDPGKVAVAIAKLRALLAPDGRLLITAPYGFSPGLDSIIRDGVADSEVFYERGPTAWLSVTREAVMGVPIPVAHPRVAVVWVAEFTAA